MPVITKSIALCLVCSAGSWLSPLPALHAQEAGELASSRDTLIAAARDIIEASRYGALVTLDESGHPRVRTMDPFAPDEDMVIWFGTNRQTRKVKEIENDPRVTLYYPAPDTDGYVTIYGVARLVDDPAEKARRWKPEWGRFYPDREATYLLIAVTPERMEIVSYSHGIVGDPDTWRPAFVEFPDPNVGLNPAN
ncbi:MAG: pyridoxamine 5'-phosphate oxidase family protein [Gemmatimonadales bacterium]|nr:pyridoxamine 5'-phosphate oxidase family protein [Gemmatimonadales bacterium]